MKKQLLTGALALSMMLGTTGMAMAADTAMLELKDAQPMKAQAVTAAVTYDSLENSTGNMTFDLKNLQPYTAEAYALEIVDVKADLAAKVADGAMTQAEADAVLADMAETLQEIKSGTMKMYQVQMPAGAGNATGDICYMSVVEAGKVQLGDAKTGDVNI